MKKIAWFSALMVVMFLTARLVTFKTHWKQCTVCGVQDYERSLCGISIEKISDREYDEWGTYAEWKKLHGGRCFHTWVAPTTKNPAVRLVVK